MNRYRFILVTRSGCPACHEFLHDSWPTLKPMFKTNDVVEIDLDDPNHRPLPPAVMNKLEFVPQFFVVDTKDGSVSVPRSMLNTEQGFNEIKKWSQRSSQSSL